MTLTLEDFRRRIEYSLCQQFASRGDVAAFCERARAAQVGVACFNPVNVAQGVELLAGSGIEISSNIGFPFGTHPTEAKRLETELSVRDGATQIDMVINVGALRSGLDEVVVEDVRAVVAAAESRPVKTIIETWVLKREELERACLLTEKAGAALVKTTTGVRTQYLEMMRREPGDSPDLGPRGAVVEEIRIMRSVLQPKTRIKASGGIYTLDYALELIRAGADQLGMSRGEEIAREFQRRYGERVEL
jgi:deoxyribose-phosphate aldolase